MLHLQVWMWWLLWLNSVTTSTISSITSDILEAMADSKDTYIAALEKKLEEISGIDVEQIQKKYIADVQGRAFKEMASYVDNIIVQSAGIATPGDKLQIAAIFQNNSELDGTGDLERAETEAGELLEGSHSIEKRSFHRARWSTPIDACIRNDDFKQVAITTSLQHCKEKCDRQNGCVSVVYRDEFSQCSTSPKNSRSHGFHEPCYYRGFVFTEKRPVATCDTMRCGVNERCTDNGRTQPGVCSCRQGYVKHQGSCKETCERMRCGENQRCTDNGRTQPGFCSCKQGYVNHQGSCKATCRIMNCGGNGKCNDNGGNEPGICKVPDQGLIRWSEPKDACIEAHNTQDFKNVYSFQDCKEKCQILPICESVEYKSDEYYCIISVKDSRDKDYLEPCYIRGWLYSERLPYIPAHLYPDVLKVRP